MLESKILTWKIKQGTEFLSSLLGQIDKQYKRKYCPITYMYIASIKESVKQHAYSSYCFDDTRGCYITFPFIKVSEVSEKQKRISLKIPQNNRRQNLTATTIKNLL